MARPLRLECAGALYHLTSRGDSRNAIYRADEDRKVWLEILGNVCDRFHWVVHAYSQMTNHYHVRVETIDGHLSRRTPGGLESPEVIYGLVAQHLLLNDYQEGDRNRKEAMTQAYLFGAYTHGRDRRLFWCTFYDGESSGAGM